MGILDPALAAADNWPQYRFNPGSPKALHAVAVISACFNSFERILFDLYIHHPDRKKYHRLISERYFLTLDERKKLDLIKDIFKLFERRPRVIAALNNLVDYFAWCADVRHSVLHGEIYPTIISSTTDLNLVKRITRKSLAVGYLSLDLTTLRYLADRIEDGRLQAAKIKVHLRYRDTKPRSRSPMLRAHGREPLPKKLHVPEPLKLSPRPHYGPKPQYEPRAPRA